MRIPGTSPAAILVLLLAASAGPSALPAADAPSPPAAAVAHWKVAVARVGDLRSAPSAQALREGAQAIAAARAVGGRTERECELIDAVAQYYHRHEERTHDSRLVHFERAEAAYSRRARASR